jgi:hypothetical protein
MITAVAVSEQSILKGAGVDPLDRKRGFLK